MERTTFGSGTRSTWRVVALCREYVLRVLATFKVPTLLVPWLLQVFRMFVPGCIACTRVSALLVLPVIAVVWPLVRLTFPVPAVFRPLVLKYSQYSEYEMYSILRVYELSYDCCLQWYNTTTATPSRLVPRLARITSTHKPTH